MFSDTQLAAAKDLGIGDETSWTPARLVFPGPWSGHIPFAFWLTKVTQPKVIVELGTHSGNSFGAFCQAIKAFGYDTKVFAVDTWEGDPHAGYYGDEIYQDLFGFVDKNYSEFSTLLRTTFDNAVSRFSPGTIDILHIDGMHTYEAVKHDFLTWRDYLSEKGLVLFHDTNVRERGFGVWRFWEEISQQYPSFEFKHSNGLGVLAVGGKLPDAIRPLFELSDKTEAVENVRTIFSHYGATFELQTDIMALERAIAELNGRVAGLNGDVARYEAQISDMSATHEARIVDMKDALAEAQEIQKRNTVLLASIAEVEQSVERLRNDNSILHGTNVELSQKIHKMRRSLSWKVTKPIRLISSGIKLVRKTIKAQQTKKKMTADASVGGAVAAVQRLLHPSTINTKDAVKASFKKMLDAFLQRQDVLRFELPASPDISIILILYNQAEFTYACLTSIQEEMKASGLNIEIIIFDNGSKDTTSELLDRIENAKIIRSEENLHFLRGVNKAAEHATGKYVLLLNNDARLRPGTLRAALQTFETEANVGAVGGRIVLPDGTLQEAGSIIWSDGSCLGYGRGRNPEDGEFLFQRDVDYCSGAFLLTPRELFEEMGRFDTAFSPAYYEETDYCVRIWKSGRRIIYNPDVVIDHYEFASSATTSDAIELQKTNLTTFKFKHAEWLRNQPSPHGNVFCARCHKDDKPHILFIEDRVPRLDLGAGFPRARDIVHELCDLGASLTLFTTAGHPDTLASIRKNLPLAVEVIQPKNADKELIDFLQARRGSFDAILVSRPHNMDRIRKARQVAPQLFSNVKVIYDAEALFSLREIIRAEQHGKPKSEVEKRAIIEEEIALASGTDLIYSVSKAEKNLMVEHGLANVHILGHKLELAPTKTCFEDRKKIVFLGALHDNGSPNADSLRWLVEGVLPHIRARLGKDLRVTVVGRNEASSINKLAGTHLDLLGPLDDLVPVFEEAKLMVIPTRFAAGIPHKAHQAAAFGVPLVTTELIATQLDWVHGEDLLASSDGKAFADYVCELYSNEALWNSLRENALKRVAHDCSAELFKEALGSTIELVKHKG